jgi:hypothetical protein
MSKDIAAQHRRILHSNKQRRRSITTGIIVSASRRKEHAMRSWKKHKGFPHQARRRAALQQEPSDRPGPLASSTGALKETTSPFALGDNPNLKHRSKDTSKTRRRRSRPQQREESIHAQRCWPAQRLDASKARDRQLEDMSFTSRGKKTTHDRFDNPS